MKIRSSSRLSSLLLALSLIPAIGAAEVPLRAFSASYDLHSGKRHFANTELKLERVGEHWRWSSLTTAQGIYAWFTRKQPYAETNFSQTGSEFRLIEILHTDAPKKKHHEVAHFDWSKGELKVLRKGKSRQMQLQTAVYDYQSIHLLAAIMGQQQLQTTTVDFYHKGKLIKTQLDYSGRQSIDIDGQAMDVRVYEQVTGASKSRIRYFYDAGNPLLPLRIEKFEPGEKPAFLTLRRVDWGL